MCYPNMVWALSLVTFELLVMVCVVCSINTCYLASSHRGLCVGDTIEAQVSSFLPSKMVKSPTTVTMVLLHMAAVMG